eukprot:503378-Alexandrium_andersonii.AAC.1
MSGLRRPQLCQQLARSGPGRQVMTRPAGVAMDLATQLLRLGAQNRVRREADLRQGGPAIGCSGCPGLCLLGLLASLECLRRQQQGR